MITVKISSTEDIKIITKPQTTNAKDGRLHIQNVCGDHRQLC
jgi:hypothetical protein